MEAVLHELHAEWTAALFLEVDEVSRPSIYYDKGEGKRADGLIMARDLKAPARGKPSGGL